MWLIGSLMNFKFFEITIHMLFRGYICIEFLLKFIKQVIVLSVLFKLNIRCLIDSKKTLIRNALHFSVCRIVT